MKNLGREATRDLLMLSMAAGSADAAGFMGVGHVFTSNMTGNLVLLGIACGQGQWNDAIKTFYVVGMFAVGAACGGRMTRQLPDQAWRRLLKRILTLESILLISFAICWALISEKGRLVGFYWLIPLLSIAMGLQSAVMSRLTIAGVTNTAMTGTLTNVAVGLERVMFGTSDKEPGIQRRTGKQLLVILLYCGGALVEGLLMLHANRAIGFLPAALVFLVMLAHLKIRM
jgi:uncharacterized membrane protein YoaK (UPF0700 family)